MGSRVGVVALLLLGVLFWNDSGGSDLSAAQVIQPRIMALSNDPTLVSGGDVLVEVEGVDDANVVELFVNDTPVDPVEKGSDGRFVKLVEGLRIGENTLSAEVAGQRIELEITNHPQGGPVFSGPQIQPWKCQEGAIDEWCNQPPEYDYFYKSSLLQTVQEFDPDDSLPFDLATTTTQTGEVVPFVVRRETGWLDRSQYQIAALYDPAEGWSATQPQPQWNRKLLVNHGANCGVSYAATNAPSVMMDSVAVEVPFVPIGTATTEALGHGFMVMSTALNDAGDNCTLTTQAESVMMAKERVVEQYGEVRFTIGAGCSGGSLAIQQVANAYPGIYDGLIAQCAFPDAGSTASQITDFKILVDYFLGYFERYGFGGTFSLDDLNAVMGDVAPINALVSLVGFFESVRPDSECKGTDSESRYSDSNPGGVRCTITDFAINMLGPRDPSVWSEAEQSIGRGFAGLPIDNVGVQYGLKPLQEGTLTPGEFLDLNAHVGGLDIDLNATNDRTVADQQTLANAYRTGSINVGNNLDRVPILHLVGPNPGLAHDAYRAWTMRARLDREQGHHHNNAIWYGPLPVLGQLDFMNQGIAAMDRWLESIEADSSEKPLAQKVIERRPDDIVDECRVALGTDLPAETVLESRRQYLPLDFAKSHEVIGREVRTALETDTHPSLDANRAMVIDAESNLLCGPGAASLDFVSINFGSPRMAAGHDIAGDDQKCVLKSPDRGDDYGPNAFTEDQWNLMATVFPSGVCDLTQPAVSFAQTVGWLSYGDRDAVVYGGSPLELTNPDF